MLKLTLLVPITRVRRSVTFCSPPCSRRHVFLRAPARARPLCVFGAQAATSFIRRSPRRCATLAGRRPAEGRREEKRKGTTRRACELLSEPLVRLHCAEWRKRDGGPRRERAKVTWTTERSNRKAQPVWIVTRSLLSGSLSLLLCVSLSRRAAHI